MTGEEALVMTGGKALAMTGEKALAMTGEKARNDGLYSLRIVITYSWP